MGGGERPSGGFSGGSGQAAGTSRNSGAKSTTTK